RPGSLPKAYILPDAPESVANPQIIRFFLCFQFRSKAYQPTSFEPKIRLEIVIALAIIIRSIRKIALEPFDFPFCAVYREG
ncbi:MAG TPA: hypothetical protein VLA12_03190, partial [Planctomycetaceae bacterium]|nr:hypothetical protein [Planctomycetaceae bacterium]